MLRHENRSPEDKPVSSMAASGAEYKPNFTGGSSYIILQIIASILANLMRGR